MQRNLLNLERLFHKYQIRYGGDDTLVRTIHETIASEKSRNVLHWPLHTHYPRTLRRTGGRLPQ